MNAFDAGILTVRPGQALPSLSSTRREWAGLLGRGKPAAQMPALLASLYTLCGGAHRLAAQHALAAAAGAEIAPTAADRETLRMDTLREHLRRIALDWPRIWPRTRPGLDTLPQLADCPLMHGGGVDDNARTWVETQLLAMPAQDWLQGWNAAPQAFVTAWAARGATATAGWLHAARKAGQGWMQRPTPLAAHASPLELEHLARQLKRDEGFALQPLWRGHTAETGTWTRLADAAALRGPDVYSPAFMRLASRLADVARLLGDNGALALAQGAQAIAPGEGIGYTEMARGLLIHWVQLGDDGTVDRYRVLAPTEWNFHPFGAMARIVAALPTDTPAVRVQLLAAAFDPCVSIEIAAPAVDPSDA